MGNWSVIWFTEAFVQCPLEHELFSGAEIDLEMKASGINVTAE